MNFINLVPEEENVEIVLKPIDLNLETKPDESEGCIQIQVQQTMLLLSGAKQKVIWLTRKIYINLYKM